MKIKIYRRIPRKYNFMPNFTLLLRAFNFTPLVEPNLNWSHDREARPGTGQPTSHTATRDRANPGERRQAREQSVEIDARISAHFISTSMKANS
jgi:hypothetical protein